VLHWGIVMRDKYAKILCLDATCTGCADPNCTGCKTCTDAWPIVWKWHASPDGTITPSMMTNAISICTYNGDIIPYDVLEIPRVLRPCRVCNKLETKACPICRREYYCSDECRIKDVDHNPICGPIYPNGRCQRCRGSTTSTHPCGHATLCGMCKLAIVNAVTEKEGEKTINFRCPICDPGSLPFDIA
jgi:hypothetical protein